MLLAHAMMLGLGGIPVIWMGDELGLPNDPGWADDPAHADDNRWVHRPRMPWPVPTEPDGIRGGAAPAGVRGRLPHLHAAGRPRSGTRATRVSCWSCDARRTVRC